MGIGLVIRFSIDESVDVDNVCFQLDLISSVDVNAGSWHCCSSLMLKLMMILPSWPSIDYLL